MEFLNSLLLPTNSDLVFLGYLVIFAVTFLETIAFVGLMIPGTSMLVLSGFLASQDIFSPAALFWSAVFGSVTGEAITYYLGGHGIYLFKDNSRFFKKRFLERGERFFKKYGAKSIFLARFFGPIRSIVPFVAGLSRMNRGEFHFYNILSAIIWAIGCLALGYFFGGALEVVKGNI